MAQCRAEPRGRSTKVALNADSASGGSNRQRLSLSREDPTPLRGGGDGAHRRTIPRLFLPPPRRWLPANACADR
jgi:hypothetical protein